MVVPSSKASYLFSCGGWLSLWRCPRVWFFNLNPWMEVAESGQRWPVKNILLSCTWKCFGDEPWSEEHVTCETLSVLLYVKNLFMWPDTYILSQNDYRCCLLLYVQVTKLLQLLQPNLVSHESLRAGRSFWICPCDSGSRFLLWLVRVAVQPQTPQPSSLPALQAAHVFSSSLWPGQVCSNGCCRAQLLSTVAAVSVSQ